MGLYSNTMKKEVITLKGDRNLWMEFTIKLKRQKREVWKVLEPWIEKYLKEK